jgi:archaellum biogenesis protein FlaJ (TadC family)
VLLPTSTQPDDLAELSARKSGTIPVMDSLKNLQVIRIAMLASVVFYGVIATLVPSNAEPNPVVFYAFAAIAIMEVVGIFGLRRAISPQTATLSPPDEKVSVKPETALIIIYCLSEAVALYGLVLHFFGFSFVQVATFFFAGLVLLFFFEPRRVVGSAIL